MPLSDDLADLVNKKIREFEQSCAEESEKTQKAQKGRARATAKTKLKKVKQLVSGSDTDADKVKALFERLEAEHQQVQVAVSEQGSRLDELRTAERERDSGQSDLNKGLGVKSKLESLCRQLQQQTNALIEERRQLTDRERQRRQELADEFQHTIGDVKKKMDQQAQERARLARENEDLRNRFKIFFEQYDKREKELMEQQRAREVEVQFFEMRLQEQAALYRQEAAKEAAAQREHEELTSTDQVLRGQLQTYSNKFSHFQDALKKSDTVLGQYKRQKNKMQRRVEVVEKENAELRSRNDRRSGTLCKERDGLLREKEELQERCKQLQADRQALQDEMQRLQSDPATAGA